MHRHGMPSKTPAPRKRASILSRLWADEQGGEVIEYVLIAGLIVAATVAVVASFGTKVMARWTSVNASM